VLIILVNLRGVREASTAFAIPTYLFIGSVLLMIATGLVRWMLGDAPIAESAQFAVQAEDLSQAAVILLILRAFSSGCSALTGVEAVSNGVPAFRKPKVRNAQTTLVLMGSIAIIMFAGLTLLALVAGVHYAENPVPPDRLRLQGRGAAEPHGPGRRRDVRQRQHPLLRDPGGDGGGPAARGQHGVQRLPLLGSVLARDGYAPKALNTRGDRLVYSNGMIILGLAAVLVLVIFQAKLTTLIQLYIIGVFVSFSLGQLGMVKHWRRELRLLSPKAVGERREAWSGLFINSLGATFTSSCS
jgi:amino acid transporter